MDCTEEIKVLQKSAGKVPGVKNLEFNLLSASMSVTVEDVVAAEQILQAVSQTGMKATFHDEAAFLKNSQASGPDHKKNALREWLCGLSGLLALAGFLAHASSHESFLHALSAAEGPGPHEFPLGSMLLYIGAIVAGGWFIFPKALQAIRRLRADMNLLMTLAVLGAAILNEWVEAAAIAFLFALAQLLETWSVARARRAIHSLLKLTPPTARVVDGSSDGHEIPVEDVPVGVLVAIRPGERVPLDGKIVRGQTTVNQAPITGESLPIERHEGDELFAGSINEDGAVQILVDKPAADTTLARIIRMVEQAQARRAPSEQWVERFAHYYTPAMILLALSIAILPPLLTSGSWHDWFYQALVLLVIACPCALVISTPVSIIAGLTAAARNGVLIKGGLHLEQAARVRAVAMDKTGTLTHGRPEVQRIVPLNQHTRQELMERAAALESHSSHPLADAIRRKAAEEGIRPPPCDHFKDFRGRGVEASIDGRPYWLGSHRLVHDKKMETPEIHAQAEVMEDAGHSVVAIGNDQHICGLISVADTLRPEATRAVQALKQEGIREVVMLTGDNEGTARAIARQTNIDRFMAELLPENKLQAIEELGRTYGSVAMVGDGINDAPALAAAHLSIAMGAAGSDAAIETADVALMSDDLMKIPWLIRHGKRTLRTIRQNVSFALAVKAVFMLLALANMATLWTAIMADMGASLIVIFNGLRLLSSPDRRL
ncbi:MAG TPA: cadmium-translocating P-type ATPase [Verrucomicrobia bacterium]|nr:cadmium-translocating P-type ATPase [Verrucomicrobiota bacterium]